MKNRIHVYLLIALLLAVFTVISIKWPQKKKPVGDEYTSHIYYRNEFYLFYPLKTDDGILFKYGSDGLYDCEWDFNYNDEAEAYEISVMYDGSPLYVTLNNDNELELSYACVDNSARWNLIKVRNTIYYAITNAANPDYAIRLDEADIYDFGMASELDIENHEFWMRLQ